MRKLLGVVAFSLLSVVLSLACSSSDPSACAIPIDAEKELLINEPSVLADRRASNAQNGPWSFRYAMENMAPSGMDAGEFVEQWLRTFERNGTFNGYALNREDRSGELNRVVLCPWYRRTPTNACNDDCSVCTAKKLDLAQSPFRLEAIVNRIDLRERFQMQPAGEGRLVFGMLDRSADDPNANVVAFGLTIEYRLPDSRTPKQWAEAWHALASFPAYDEAYRQALQELTDAFVKRGSSPSGRNGSALAQVRTNEAALNWIWQLREFMLDDRGSLEMVPVHNTPAPSLNGSAVLADWLNKNRQVVLQKKHEIPASLRGGAADALLDSWNVPGVEPDVRKAFAEETCNGCHSGENISVDSAFHISPFRKGREALSPFIRSRTGGPDELTRRADSQRQLLCGPRSGS